MSRPKVFRKRNKRQSKKPSSDGTIRESIIKAVDRCVDHIFKSSENPGKPKLRT